MIRLDKFLCDSGAGTRSQVRGILKSGRVQVDGAAVRDPAAKIDPATQQITLDGEILGGRRRIVLMMNKPAGYVTATKDAKETTVMALLPEEYRKAGVNPVGRLDKATEGLLLFTNDGALLHRLIAPKSRVEKVYYARHEGQATREDVDAFARGICLADGEQCLPAVLEILGPGESRITVYEGKYHQVRRMMASRALPVSYLERIREGLLHLNNLSRGEVRLLTPEEVALLEENVAYLTKK